MAREGGARRIGGFERRVSYGAGVRTDENLRALRHARRLQTREYGDLEITYLDLDLMVCRGANSTVYVFVQTNSNYRIGDTTSGNVNRQLGA